MKFQSIILLCLSVLLGSVPVWAAEVTAEQIQLTLPPAIYTVPNSEMSLYFQNSVLYEPASDLKFAVFCDIGHQQADRWIIEPERNQVGMHKLTLTVSDQAGNEIVSASSIVHVAPREAGTGKQLRLLIIGDSLTHATIYPNRIHQLCSRPDNPELSFLGTHKPTSAAEGVAHEGYGGWAWETFLTRYVPAEKSDGTYRTRSSPFVRLDENGKPVVDIQDYINNHCYGVPPDIVVFKLGINDCFRADQQNPDARIDEVLNHADQLISEFRKAAPEALFGICLTTPGNSRDEAFDANYQGKYTRRGWKQIQHRLVQRYIAHFGNRENKRISLIPTETNLDITAGYPDNNAVHPNKAGYEQIGDSIYAWLKFQLTPKKGT
ncbi:MAG: hypothetical protein KDA65_02870 [Planctomycetaceae bacterium]|nr:hypothetical protein [Planctomycetaceae bacterium]